MKLIQVTASDDLGIATLAKAAAEIWREHYTAILGPEQTDYMVEKFQSERAMRDQLAEGYTYYMVYDPDEGTEPLGFMGFYPREDAMYLSKFYLYKHARRKGYGRRMLAFLSDITRDEGLSAIELNVNKYNSTSIAAYEKLGFTRIRAEVIDIGNGYVMDDYVYRLELK